MCCVEKVLKILKLSFNRFSPCWKRHLIERKKHKMKAKSCFSLNADFNYFSELVFVDKSMSMDIVFFLSVCIQAKEYWLLQMLTQHTAKIWKKIKRFNLKNKSTCSEENKRSVSRGGKCRGVALEELVWCFHFGLSYISNHGQK